MIEPVSHERMRSMYAAADLLVMPGVGEGLPVVVQEALICGTPVLTSVETAAGLAGRRTAVHAWDSATDSLSCAIDKALAQGRDVQAISTQARQRWDLAEVVERYEALMRTALALPRR